MDILEFLSVIGLSSVKVLPGLALAIAHSLNPLEIFVCLFGGGMLGVAGFSYFASRIRDWRKARRKAKALEKGPSDEKERPFTSRRIRQIRRIKIIWNKFGLVGIAVLTPPLISPPFGSIIAVALGAKFSKIMVYMAVSMAAWAALLAVLGKQILNLIG